MVALRKNAALALQAKVSEHFPVIAAPCVTQDECTCMHHTYDVKTSMQVKLPRILHLSSLPHLHTTIKVLSHKLCRCNSATMLPM